MSEDHSTEKCVSCQHGRECHESKGCHVWHCICEKYEASDDD